MNADDPKLTDRLARWRENIGYHVGEYRSWFAKQSARRLVTTAVFGIAAAIALYWIVWLAGMLVAGLVDLLFIADAPPPPPPPAAPPSPLDLAVRGVINHIGHALQQWSAAHAFGGVDPGVVPLMWLVIGAGLLLFSQSPIGVPLFSLWAAATVWTTYDATGTANPVPAALTAGAIALAWGCWWFLGSAARALLR